MRIGQMDRDIAVFKYVAPVGTGNSPTYRFSHDEWMAKKPLRADEKYSAQASQRYEDVAVRFTAYPIEGLQTVDILRDEQGRFWDIRGIVEIGYDEGIEIDATLRTTAPEIEQPAEPSPPASYSFTVSAGQNSSWTGYLIGVFGNVDSQPIPGGTIESTVVSRSIAGDGGIEIAGSVSALQPLLGGKEVWIGGVKIDGEWSFDPGLAMWWSSTFPAIANEGTYLVEIRVEP